VKGALRPSNAKRLYMDEFINWSSRHQWYKYM